MIERLLKMHAELIGFALLPLVLLYVFIVGDQDWMEEL